jgi:hypothetical protein
LPDGVASSKNADLDWVSDILAAPALKRTVGRRQRPDSARETFAVLPTAARPRYVVSLASRRAAAAAVGDAGYAPDVQIRLAHALGRLGITLGLVEHVFRDRLSIAEGDLDREQPLCDLLLSERLATIFGRRDLTLAVHVRPSRPNRKPLVRVLSKEGAFVGYVKVGWNVLTRRLVQNEARTLTEIDRRQAPLTALEVPRVVYAGPWREFELLALTPLRGRALRMTRRHLDVVAAAMSEISQFVRLDERPLADSDYWRATKARAREMTDDDVLPSFADIVEERFGEEVLGLGSWHGDWAPWNMAWRDGRVAVWDWERSSDEAPAGLDAAHFDFQVALVAVRNRSLEALERTLKGEAPLVSALGLPPERQRLLLSLHLLEMALRWEEGRRAGMSPTDSLYAPALAALLDQPAPHPPPSS